MSSSPLVSPTPTYMSTTAPAPNHLGFKAGGFQAFKMGTTSVLAPLAGRLDVPIQVHTSQSSQGFNFGSGSTSGSSLGSSPGLELWRNIFFSKFSRMGYLYQPGLKPGSRVVQNSEPDLGPTEPDFGSSQRAQGVQYAIKHPNCTEDITIYARIFVNRASVAGRKTSVSGIAH
ncbi:hypothetical protein B0H13DRAFT_1928577 [Mycena leptocephala]|nr:hypothetical protein B0H13DRAFT_1928577 [Mycena leptocephala]